MRRDTHVTICTISFFLSVSPYYVIYCISKFCFFIFVGCINCCISNIYLWLLKHARSPYSCIWIQWGLVIALTWGVHQKCYGSSGWIHGAYSAGLLMWFELSCIWLKFGVAAQWMVSVDGGWIHGT